jgi:folate-dependent tRNA-U54 methylase TrmFO/GidA
MIVSSVIARPDMQDAQVVECFLHIRARKLLRASLQMRARLRVLFAGRISGIEG